MLQKSVRIIVVTILVLALTSVVPLIGDTIGFSATLSVAACSTSSGVGGGC